MRMLVTIPTLAGRRFTYVAYLDDSGSCFPFPAEENLNAQRTQRGLCPLQATSDRARISWPAAPGKAITGISEVRKKFRSGPYPSFRWATISRTQLATGSASIMLSIAARRFAS